MIILNEHMHSNMIDVYQEKQEWHSGNVPIIWTSFHQKKIPKRNAFLSKFLKKIFSSKRSLIPQQGCSRLLSSEGVIPAPGLGQVSASEDYASSSFPFERTSELPVTFDSPSSSQRSFN